MNMNAAPMVYSRVLRAIAAANPQVNEVSRSGRDNNEATLNELADQLNQEFAMLGVRVSSSDLAAHRSALDIARHITQKIK